MKTIVSLVLTAVCAFLCSNCASVDTSNTEPTLSAAGFVARAPETAKQRELYDALPAYKLHRAAAKGSVIYAYKDEKKGFAYVGNEAAYKRYQQLAAQQRVTNDSYQAIDMNSIEAGGWNGAYAPWVGASPVYR